MDKTVTTSKSVFGITAAVLGFLYNSINELVIVLVLLILMDYILGILQCFKDKVEFNKELALWGIAKKVLYGFVLAVGFLADYIIIYFSQHTGVILPVNSMFGIAAIAYLLGTEGFSVAKHLIAIGIPTPEFLLKFFGLMKDQSGKIVQFKEENLNE